MFDLAIVGGGPAGIAAGVYASRKRLKTVFITKDWGGQSAVSTEIQNWIGTVTLSGAALADALKAHLAAYASDTVAIKEGETALRIEKNPDGFTVTTNAGAYKAKAILIATGSHRRKLPAKNAEKFENKGISYCASCDGPLFSGEDVAVVGGGNAGFETAAELLAYCKSVVLLHRGDEFKADPVTVKKVLANPKMHAVLNAEILEIAGDTFVSGLLYRDKETDKKTELPVRGIFAEIGSVPTTDSVKDLVALSRYGNIVTDPKNQRTSAEGVWAAGDATDGLYHQNNIAAGDAVKALEDIYLWLHVKK